MTADKPDGRPNPLLVVLVSRQVRDVGEPGLRFPRYLYLGGDRSMVVNELMFPCRPPGGPLTRKRI